MSDIADDAQVQVDAFISASIAAAHRPVGPVPKIIDGVVCCAECGAEIPAKRLAALPGVGLCVVCAEEEHLRRQFERA